mgnify:CR=1 FL=1
MDNFIGTILRVLSLRNKSMAYIIVVSGLSGSGKTTLTTSLLGSGILRVPSASTLRRERYEFPDVSSTREAALLKQNYYFELDKKASQIAVEIHKNGRTAICDRDFLSALAHNYALHHTKPETSVYPWLVENYTKALENDELVMPDFHIFLDIPLEERKNRAIKEVDRERDSCFFDSDFCENYMNFYKGALKCMPSLWLSTVPKNFSLNSLNLESLPDHKKQSKKALVHYIKSTLNERNIEFSKVNTPGNCR